MAITYSTSSTDVAGVKSDQLAVPVFDGVRFGDAAKAVDDALGGGLKRFLKASGFKAKVGETLVVPPGEGLSVKAVVVVGAGKRGEVTAEHVRRMAANVARRSRESTEITASFLDLASDGLDEGEVARAVAEGVGLGVYRYLDQKTEPEKPKLRRVKFLGGGDTARRAMTQGELVARGATLARDLVNGPPQVVTPTEMARVARRIKGVRTTVWDQARCKREGLGGLLGVAAGSDEPPRLIRMTYAPQNARATVAIVGKGITFDSGGISLKPTGAIETMKYDMAGGAAVIGLMSIVAELAPPLKVIGIVPATENMPSGKATKLGDVLGIRNGKSVEVLNTDAEGRLVLADGLSLAVEDEPDAIVDLATLTGSCPIALGDDIAGVLSNHDDVVEQVREASERSGERVWRLPLVDDYRKLLDSDVADIKNVSSGRSAGTITAALFLREFVDEVPWAHLDIAGPAWRSNGASGHLSKGGTGYGVRLLAEMLTGFRKPRRSRRSTSDA